MSVSETPDARSSRTQRPRANTRGSGSSQDEEGRCSAWLSAYALGLAHTERCVDHCVVDLLASSRGRIRLLREAARQLETLTDVDTVLRTQAIALLNAAVASARPDRRSAPRSRSGC